MYRSGHKGWSQNLGHGLWDFDGARYRGYGGSEHCAFWNGFDGVQFNPRRRVGYVRRPMYKPGTRNRAVYMAGRDMKQEHTEQTRRTERANRRLACG